MVHADLTRVASSGRCVVIVGAAGIVGQAFASGLIESGWRVGGLDRRAKPTSIACADWFQMDARRLNDAAALAVRNADAVIVALSTKETLGCASELLAIMRPGALFIETCSVKAGLWSALGPSTGHVEAVGINPMFSPSLGFCGRPVAWVTVRAGALSALFRAAVLQWGADIVDVDPEQHDQITASSQALTHAMLISFSRAVIELNVDPTLLRRLATPLLSTMLSLLARMTGGQPSTYWEIQRENVNAEAARSAAAKGLNDLIRIIDTGDEDRFSSMLSDAAGLFQGTREQYEDVALQMFSIAQSSNPSPATRSGQDHR